MIKHTLEISERPARLSLRNKQLVLKHEELERAFACEDVGVLVLQNPAISLSSAVLNALLESGAVVVLCNHKHLPSGLLLPTISHTELVPRMMTQLASSLPARKQVWKALVQAKIRAQADGLEDPEKRKLQVLSQEVKSGDSDNCEAQAAKIYWPARFSECYQSGDKRDPTSESLFNSLLNYGYALIRASVARALVSAGLQPALGVFHHRRNNPFCLADDVMEPLRPLVDRKVKELLTQEDGDTSEGLQKYHRKELLKLLATSVMFNGNAGPLMSVLPRYINSFYRVLTQEEQKLEVPKY